MKKCPECGYELPDEIAYCLYCGTNTNISKQIKSDRKLFFLSPIFFLLISLGLIYDLGSANYLEYGIATAGIVTGVYYFGAILLAIFVLFTKLKSTLGYFFIAGLIAVINAITSLFAVFAIENLYLQDFFYNSGPTAIIQKHTTLIISIFLIVQFIETFAILLKIKLTNIFILKNKSLKLYISNFHFIICLLFIALTSFGVYSTSMSDKIAFLSESLMRISANSKAEEYIDKGLEKYPDSAKLCYLKASVLSEPDEVIINITPEKEIEALKYAEKAVTLKPSSPLYKSYLSIQLDINRQYEQAVKLASEAATLAVNDVFLWLNLGNLNLKRFNYKEAIVAYKQALNYDPENVSALNNLAYVLLLNNQDFSIALALAEKAIELSPNSISLIDTLAWAYYKNNRIPEALETINRLYVNRNEMIPEIDFHRAAILNEMDLLNKPIETYDKMLIKPEVAMNKGLIKQIIEARNRAEEKLKTK